MIGHTLRQNEELLVSYWKVWLKGHAEEVSHERNNISQVIKDARVDSYKQLKDLSQDRESRGEHLS